MQKVATTLQLYEPIRISKWYLLGGPLGIGCELEVHSKSSICHAFRSFSVPICMEVNWVDPQEAPKKGRPCKNPCVPSLFVFEELFGGPLESILQGGAP